jgi:metallo-beta-lactamase family protein
MAELLFHGAAGEVTGSMHLVRVQSNWVALDCGLFQGRRAESEAKNRQWPVPPSEIAAVVLSHAHIDHTGRLPKLVKDGFAGDVFCTPATRDLSAIMLPDSAHIQEEDATYVSKKRREHGETAVEPLYTLDDTIAAVSLMHSVNIGRWFDVVPGIRARYHEAGHMLGSAGIELKLGFNEATHTLYFTGDVGRPHKPILNDPGPFPPCDTLICESTYGDRDSSTLPAARQAFFDIMKRTIERGGKLIIPAFAVGRSQLLVYFLQEWMDAGELPCIPVYVDSPLAVNATEIYKMHPELWDADAKRMFSTSGDFLKNRCVTYIENVDDSKALNFKPEPCVIISASGMCEGGRIRHHLKNNITNKKNTILIPGYQAEHTLGRRLADHAPKVRIFQQEFDVKAEVVQLDGFSAHADRTELIRHINSLGDVHNVYLVHGEDGPRAALRDAVQRPNRKVHLPTPGVHVKL